MAESFLWRVIILPSAERDMKRLPPLEQGRIRAPIDSLANDPAQVDIRRLRGSDDEWRLRVGDWRVRFAFDTGEQTIIVLRVLHRREAYRV